MVSQYFWRAPLGIFFRTHFAFYLEYFSVVQRTFQHFLKTSLSIFAEKLSNNFSFLLRIHVIGFRIPFGIFAKHFSVFCRPSLIIFAKYLPVFLRDTFQKFCRTPLRMLELSIHSICRNLPNLNAIHVLIEHQREHMSRIFQITSW